MTLKVVLVPIHNSGRKLLQVVRLVEDGEASLRFRRPYA
jgi:hypothetical protein